MSTILELHLSSQLLPPCSFLVSLTPQMGRQKRKVRSSPSVSLLYDAMYQLNLELDRFDSMARKLTIWKIPNTYWVSCMRFLGCMFKSSPEIHFIFTRLPNAASLTSKDNLWQQQRSHGGLGVNIPCYVTVSWGLEESNIHHSITFERRKLSYKSEKKTKNFQTYFCESSWQLVWMWRYS